MSSKSNIPRESFFVFLVASGFYVFTLCPTIGFGDTAMLVDSMLRAHLHSHVNNHPLSVFLGFIFTSLPFGSLAFRANLMSALCGATAIALLFACFRVYGVSLLVAIISALTALVSHSLWWHSTIVENYAVSAALVAACYLLLTLFQISSHRKYFFGSCIVAGLSVFNHVQNGFLCLGVALIGFLSFARKPDRVKALAICAGCALLGLAPWLGLIWRDTFTYGFPTTLKGAFVGSFQNTFFSESLGTAIYEVFYLIWWQSPLGVMLFGSILGMVAFVRRFGVSTVFAGMITHILCTLIVFAGYATWDRFAFLLPGFVGLIYFVGPGLVFLPSLQKKYLNNKFVLAWGLSSALLGATLYQSVVGWAKKPNSIWKTRFGSGYSAHLFNQAEYKANPNKHDYRDVEIFANLLLEKLPPNSIFLDDDSRSYHPLTLYFQRSLGMRPDISFQLVNSWGIANWGLDSGGLSKIVESAYFLDKPFFVTTLGNPYKKFFDSVKKSVPIQFERFHLSKNLWVYQLVTQKSQSKLDGIEALVKKRNLSPVEVQQASQEIDLGITNLIFSASNGMNIQNMARYGRSWLMDNQLFVSASGPGSEVSFWIKGKKNQKKKMILFLTRAPDFGNINITFKNKSLGEFSLFSPRVERYKIDLGEVELSKTGEVLSIRTIGKADESKGYKMGIDSIRFD